MINNASLIYLILAIIGLGFILMALPTMLEKNRKKK